jgi:hypothetical protein
LGWWFWEFLEIWRIRKEKKIWCIFFSKWQCFGLVSKTKVIVIDREKFLIRFKRLSEKIVAGEKFKPV